MVLTPRRIGLVVDHPLRDLHGMVLVAHLLSQAGHSVVLMPFYAQSFDLALGRLDLLLVNQARPLNLRLMREALRRRIPLAVLDTEGGLMPEEGPISPTGIAQFLSRTGLDRSLSSYMTWGPAFRDVLVSNTRFAARRVVATGCPRFDLAHEPWAQQSGEHEIVLINTNFAGINAAHVSGNGEDVRPLRRLGIDEETIAGVVKAARAIMHDMLEAIAQIAAARPQRQFVLRPHPFERLEPYRARFANVPNLEIRREGNVLDLLPSSACLLQLNCTTAIDAAMSGVPPISLEFCNRPEIRRFTALAGQISHRADSVEHALTLIDRGRGLGQASALEVLEPVFGSCDGRAARRVAAAAIEAANDPVAPCAPLESPGAWQTVLGLAGKTVGSSAIEALRCLYRPARNDKRFGIVAVRDALERFAAAEGVQPAHVSSLRTPLGMPALSQLVEPA